MRVRSRLLTVGLILVGLSVPVPAAQQTNPAPPLVSQAPPAREGVGAISGVAIDRATGQPLAGVHVSLSPTTRQPENEAAIQVTDAKGRFLFTRLPAYDRFLITAIKAGYVQSSYGDYRGGGPGDASGAIAVANGEWIRDLKITLTRPAAIAGSVRDDRGEPIVGAYVRTVAQLRVSGGAQLAAGRPVRTDDRGVYRIADLAPGKYYIQMASVQSAVPSGASTAALVGGAAPVVASAEASGRAITFTSPLVDADALNRFVVGQYPIPPRSDDGRLTVYPTTFYPAARDLSAAVTITVAAGEERPGTDLVVAPVTGGRISGTVAGLGDALRGLALRLLIPGTEGLGDGGEAASALVDDAGRFTFLNVPAGSYVISGQRTVAELRQSPGEAAAQLPKGPGTLILERGSGSSRVTSGPDDTWIVSRGAANDAYWAREVVSVDGRDLLNVEVTMRRGVTVSGRYLWEGARPGSPDGPSGIAAEPVEGTVPVTPRRARDTSPAGDFVIEGLVPGRFVLRVAGAMAASLVHIKSIVCAGRDFTYAPIDTTAGADMSECVVTLTNRSASLMGTVKPQDGRPRAEAAVLIFPADRAQWRAWGLSPERLKGTQTSASGEYRFDRLPAGDYLVIAVSRDLVRAWQDEEFLGKVAPDATRVTLAWGEPGRRDLVQKLVK